jgi:hypothetical protein
VLVFVVVMLLRIVLVSVTEIQLLMNAVSVLVMERIMSVGMVA